MEAGKYDSVSELIVFANAHCEGCRDLRLLLKDCIDARQVNENPASDVLFIAKIAGFTALCRRTQPVPDAVCQPGSCSTGSPERNCELAALTDMTPEARLEKIQELTTQI